MVESVRIFFATKHELGVGEDDGNWYVYDRKVGASDWHRHVGTFGSREHAEDWIKAIVENV